MRRTPCSLRARMLKLSSCIAALCITAWAQPCSADDDSGPDTEELLWLGAGLAIPADFLVTAQHEGSHALAATVFGAHVTSVQPYPVEVDGHLRFGQTTWTGALTPGQHVIVMLAPKMTDLVGLTTYDTLELTDNLPANRVAQTVMLAMVTAVWVDFTVDIGATWDKSDLGVVYSVIGANDDSARMPYRLLQGGLAALSAVPIVRGYVRLFAREPARAKENLHARIMPWADMVSDALGSSRGQIFGVRGVF
ncbi:MAG TPA: hypothetical protein VMI75_06685 [Polyangiaceae bacterium]|nr:hypothetical protein [Polyangiaceae bacterium]